MVGPAARRSSPARRPVESTAARPPASGVAGLAVLVMLFAAPEPALAHEFWIQPAQWRVEQHRPLTLSLLVGHGADRQRSPIPASRIVRFDIVARDGRRYDARSRLHLQAVSGDATISFGEPGCHIVVLETDDRAESHLPATRFNDHLEAEGLTPAIELRAQSGRWDKDGSENYSRTAKAIVQVGTGDRCDRSMVASPIGLELEIVPELSLFDMPRPEKLPVRVYYRGQPLAGALVKLTNLERDAEPVDARRSDQQGRALFAMPDRGGWQLNVVWTRSQAADRSTDFRTHFSSLTFGLPD